MVLGIDPGSRIMGYAVVRRGPPPTLVEAGVLRPKGREFADRLANLRAVLAAALERWSLDEAAVESVFHGKNTLSLIRLGEARGVILATLAERGIRVATLTPAEVKKAVTGNGHASKEQVQAMVRAILRLAAPLTPLDAADAAAVAICYLHRRKTTRPSAAGA